MGKNKLRLKNALRGAALGFIGGGVPRRRVITRRPVARRRVILI